MDPLLRIQEYLRWNAHQHHDVIAFPSFTFFFDATDTNPESNYAIPDAYEGNELQGSLARLQAIFTEYARRPCLQFIEEAFPSLGPMLLACRWVQKERSQIMICTHETYQPAPEIVGLAIKVLSYESSIEEICEGLNTNSLGFDPQAERATIDEAETFRQNLRYCRAFTACLHGQPVGAGMFTEIREGLTEIAGITTLEPFRRQGIATALTAYITQVAFQHWATLAFLIPANKQAARIYERAGFRPYATQVIYEL